MSTQLASDIFDLLDGSSDLPLSGNVAADTAPPTAPSTSNGTQGRKGKATRKSNKATDEVTRQDVTSLENKITAIADAVQTLQNTVLTSLGDPPMKKQKTSHIGVSSDDESITSGQMIDQLLQPVTDDNSSVGVLQEVEQFYSGEDSGSKIDEKLASVISKLLHKQTAADKITGKLNSFQRPANIPDLDGTKVNPEIWNSLQSKTRSMDIKLQKVEHAALKGIVPIVLSIEALMSIESTDKKALVTNLLDAVAIIGYAVTELNLRRRELIKPDLNSQFASLCSAQVPITGYLFGDNLSQQCKDIQETNKLGQKFGQRANLSATSKLSRARQHGNAKSFHGRQGNSFRQKRWQKRQPAEMRQTSNNK